ncbi:Multidrug resistance protein MdtA [BD1-7 clade bacterium]|uniref:Multidrug resistance protein MdtA n=1 Tax=BD1-7 clade bacterium TaxID=2029982 RepID=A0A5S9NYN4_9GAMM|nr:Multidrug resistance protein MdtA [BD1-7 clade bacterium]
MKYLKSHSRVLLVTLATGVSIFLALAFNAQQIKAAQKKPPVVREAVYPDVGIAVVHPGEYRAEITAWGEASAEHTLALKSDVVGRIEQLSEQFKTGNRVDKGDVLLQIDATDYQKAVADAKAQMADAQLALYEEERQSQQALEEWQQSGFEGQPTSPLVLRKPQLAKAQAVLEQAKASVAKANRDLALTRIRAPFDGVVVSRLVQPGAYVQTGTELGSLYSRSKLEVSVLLSDQQWQMLDVGTTQYNGDIVLSRANSSHQWPATFDRVEQHTHSDNRQRALIVAVDKPLEQNPPIHPGDFFEITVTGRSMEKLWRLPASAISQNNDIWLVTADNTLKAYAGQLAYRQDQWVYLYPPQTANDEEELTENKLSEARVVIRPLSSYLEGMRVNPIVEMGGQP